MHKKYLCQVKRVLCPFIPWRTLKYVNDERCEGFYGNLVFSRQKFIRLRKPLALVLRKTAVRHQNPKQFVILLFGQRLKNRLTVIYWNQVFLLKGTFYGHSEARGFLKGITMKNQYCLYFL